MQTSIATRLFPAAACMLAAVLGAAAAPAQAERIKDLAQVAGVRGNPLVGYGLVVGLDGSGDRTSQTPFTVQSLKTMLDQLGVTIPPGVNPQLKNVAAVAIQAELPPFAKPGQTIDVTVSSIGNAGSLRGGSLLMAPLKGADGQVYAIAQGTLVVSGFGASGRDGSRISTNAPNGGSEPDGRTPLTRREREVLGLLAKGITYEEAARMLGISLGTIQSHVKSLYRKLEVTSKAEAAAEAVRRGLAWS